MSSPAIRAGSDGSAQEGGPPNILYVSVLMAVCCLASLVAAYVSKETYGSDLVKSEALQSS